MRNKREPEENCKYCQGTGMTTLNPEEEYMSHFCVSADEEDIE